MGYSKSIKKIKAPFFDSPCHYDLIIGRKQLPEWGVSIDLYNDVVTLDDKSMPLHGPDYFNNRAMPSVIF